MITSHKVLAAALLVLGLHSPLGAAASKEEGHAPDPEHARLVAARKAANELPDVLAAEQQSKADRAMAHKALADYKIARKKSASSEEAYHKAFEAGLAKIDEGATAIQEKERAAFRERMLKARVAKKVGKKSGPKAAEPEEEPVEPEEKTSPQN
jgi:hypothetical protein